MGRIIRRGVAALLIVTSLLTAAIVGAAVKIFDGYGECEMGEFTTMPKVKERALERAKLDAQKQAGIYLKAESRSVASELVDDVISAVTNNIIEISDVQYETITQKITERTTAVVVVAKLKASIDPNGIYDFIKRDDKEKVTIIQQNDSLKDAIAKNDKEFEDLKEQYKRAKSQADKDRIIKQMEQVDRDFLANQKLEAGFRCYYIKYYNGAIKLCDESLQLNPNNLMAYGLRGTVYITLKQYEKAIQDSSKAIQLNPDDTTGYILRGAAYIGLNQYNETLRDINKAIQLNPNIHMSYFIRGVAYSSLNQYDRAIQDFNKAIKLNKNFVEAYVICGIAYNDINQYEHAIKYFNNAIKLNPNFAEAYKNRGIAYSKLNQYNIAIKDFDRAIELNPNDGNIYTNRGATYALLGNLDKAIADATKAIQLDQSDAKAYQLRGLIYKFIGEELKAQADFAKAKELGYNC